MPSRKKSIQSAVPAETTKAAQLAFGEIASTSAESLALVESMQKEAARAAVEARAARDRLGQLAKSMKPSGPLVVDGVPADDHPGTKDLVSWFTGGVLADCYGDGDCLSYAIYCLEQTAADNRLEELANEVRRERGLKARDSVAALRDNC